ncbi:hypothetical protein ACN3VN_05280 [Xylella fastidiosa]|uniref:hypothetical protein n=1 Tax=Xylella fastidiosa TaxID=2371 RepID=UPI0007333C92|nr:hypothetical protein [Xylella fastidiosa]
MNKTRLALLLSFLIPVTFAHAGVDNKDSKEEFIIDTPSNLSTQESTENYWTEERRYAAKPKSIVPLGNEVSKIKAETGLESYIRNQKERTEQLVIEPSTGMDWSVVTLSRMQGKYFSRIPKGMIILVPLNL